MLQQPSMYHMDMQITAIALNLKQIPFFKDINNTWTAMFQRLFCSEF